MSYKRYDTRYFVALLGAEESEAAACDEQETVEHRWLSPAKAVSEAEGGTFFVAPTTYLTLAEIANCASGLDVMQAALTREVHPIMPKLDISDGQWTVVLPGDPSYADVRMEGPARSSSGRPMAMLTALVGVALAAPFRAASTALLPPRPTRSASPARGHQAGRRSGLVLRRGQALGSAR